jgi:DNA-binding transcriptional LysR family regulator
MQFQQLRCFAAVIDQGSFTRAAESLHVAQPSLSKQIRNLEREVKASLFERGYGPARLTSAGEALVPYARRILADMASAKAEVDYVTKLHTGQVRIGSLHSLGTTLVAQALREFHSAYPAVHLVVEEAPSQDLVKSVVAGNLDLAVIVSDGRSRELGILFQPLLTEELVLAMSVHDRSISSSSVCIDDLRDIPLVTFGRGYIRNVTFAACHDAGFEPHVAVEGGDIDTLLSFVEAGLGVAVVPALCIRRSTSLRHLSFVPSVLSHTIGLACRPVPPSRAAARFRDALIRTAGKLGFSTTNGGERGTEALSG